MYFGLNEPEVIEKKNEIEKVFDYKEDLEELGKKLDKKNRENFSKEDFDSIFITSTEILEDINLTRQNENVNFDERIEKLKEEALKTEILFSSEDFDIFGSMSEDITKINNLGNQKHREIMKNKFRLLEITKNTENEQYVKHLTEIIKNLDKAMDKAKFGYKLNAFFASTLPLNNKEYNILSIDPQNL